MHLIFSSYRWPIVFITLEWKACMIVCLWSTELIRLTLSRFSWFFLKWHLKQRTMLSETAWVNSITVTANFWDFSELLFFINFFLVILLCWVICLKIQFSRDLAWVAKKMVNFGTEWIQVSSLGTWHDKLTPPPPPTHTFLSVIREETLTL